MIKQRKLIRLNNVRLSFPSIFQKKEWEKFNKEPRYEATFILDKIANASDISNINQRIDVILAEHELQKNMILSNHLCIKDGDSLLKPEYKNAFVIKCTSKNRVPVLDKNRNDIEEDSGMIYAGCYVNAVVELYCYKKMSKGIAANFLGIQFVKDGDSFNNPNNLDIINAFEVITENNIPY